MIPVFVLVLASLAVEADSPRVAAEATHSVRAELDPGRLRPGQEQTAREKAEREVAELTQDPGLGAERTQEAVQALVSILIPLRELDQAGELLERALAAGQETLGPGHPTVLHTMYSLVVVRAYQDDFKVTIALAEELALLSAEALGPLDSLTLRARMVVADVLEPLGEFERAREIYIELALQMEEALGPRSDVLAGLLHNHAYMEARVGAYDLARGLYERALDIRLEARGEDDPITIGTLQNLGSTLRSLEDLAGAREILERVVRIYRRTCPPGHPRIASSLGSLAWVRMDEGKWEEATALIEEALVIHEATLGEESLMVSKRLTQLGSALKPQGGDSLERARNALERALAIRVARLGRDALSTAHTRAILASVHWELSEIDAALAACGESLEVFELKLGPSAGPTLRLRHLMGNILFRARGPEAAIPFYQESLEQRSSGGSRSVSGNRATTQFMLGACLLGIGRHESALRLMHESFRETWTHVVSESAGMTEEELFGFLALQHPKLQALLDLPRHQDSSEARRLGYEAQLAWKGLVARLVHTTRGRVHAAPTLERAVALDELATVQRELSDLFMGREDDGERTSERIELEARRQALARSLESGSDPSLRWIEWTELRDALPAGTATLDLLSSQPFLMAGAEDGGGEKGFRFVAPHILAWVVSAESETPVRIDLGPAVILETAVREALGGLRPASVGGRGVGITAAGEGGDGRAALQRLSELLWAPLAPHFDGFERIVVSPDSFVCGLPFEVLVDSEGRHLIERFAFVYSHDLAGQLSEVFAETPRDAAPSLLVIGGVDFDARESDARELDEPLPEAAEGTEAALRGRAGSSWTPLPGTAREAGAIASLHRACFGEDGVRTELSGAGATEEAIAASLPHHNVVHLATHGFFLGASLEARLAEGEQGGGAGVLPGLLNGLVCAGVNARRQAGRADGFLTAEELGWLDLSGVELVVLSACDTAQGVSQSGEGLVGLRRAFQSTGARAVISSLWPVGDRATTELMGAFYARLWRHGDSVADAMRAAQLELLARNRKEHGVSRPSTWGAFVVAGDWR